MYSSILRRIWLHFTALCLGFAWDHLTALWGLLGIISRHSGVCLESYYSHNILDFHVFGLSITEEII
jgi:hypothetical protein